ncbi:GNAT family N-acetyltransferase [Enterobacter bugandensis]|uniref:GNAT family N-acetyltransferase n=1 Tax=Enterobacter bugandensis TaxID=881260 RepID=UPI0021D2940E|nr:GNAT family N-acetyltransferase [Enterobacter bugandensis]MCU6214461.1 GNAT family N-acetyltransferase [Enterobacter bugandensis]
METTPNDLVNGLLVCAYQSDITYPGVKHFDCGNAIVNSFVRGSLKKSVKDGNCAAKALIDKESGELLGFCSFSAYSLEKSRLAGTIVGSLPNDVGVVRLNMLGVATKEQNKGYGQDLLAEFFEQVKIIHQALPIKGVYLDADPKAVNFYARLGFVELKEPPNAFGAIPMFLAIQHILAA